MDLNARNLLIDAAHAKVFDLEKFFDAVLRALAPEDRPPNHLMDDLARELPATPQQLGIALEPVMKLRSLE
jgi:hypothetical protein